MSNFEKQVKQQGETFSITPREQVWQRLEAELDKKKGRRIIGWWWMTPLALLLAGGTYYILTPQENKQQITVSNNRAPLKTTEPVVGTTTEKETLPTRNELSKKDQAKEEATTDVTTHHTNDQKRSLPLNLIQNKNTPYPSRTNNTIHQQPVAASIAVTGAIEKNDRSNNAGKSNTVNNTATHEDVIQEEIIAGAAIIPQAADNQISNTESSSSGTLTDSTVTPLADSVSKTMTLQDSAGASSQKIAIQKPSSKKATWRLQVSGGMANNAKNNLSSTKSDLLAFAPPAQNTGGSPAVAGYLPEESNQAGASINIAIQRLQWIGKRVQWQAGVTAQYQSIRQTSGGKDSIASNGAFVNYSLNRSYNTGNSEKHTGSNVRLFLSNDIAFSLLKHQRNWLLSGGIYTGFNLYNNYLIPDYTNNIYVTSSDLYKKWFIGFDIGMEYNFKKGIGIGLTMQRDLTQSYKPLGGDKKYWQSLLFKINIPLRSK